MKRQAAINKIKEVISSVVKDVEIILFGSEARGEARSDSDFDILILSNKDRLNYREKEEITKPLFKLAYTDDIEVNVLVYTRKEWESRPFLTPFQRNIINEGIRI